MAIEHRLSSETFEVQSYIREVARDLDSSVELKRHKRNIQEVAEQTAQKLKQNVYQNYSLFINTSKEISSLEAEMYQLSHMLNEHESLTRALSNVTLMAAPEVMGEGGTEPEKHSIASLLETVEGCSSVTEVPGRFLIYSSHLTELHQDTHEDVQEVQAFLLNDSLMVAAHIRRRKGPVRYRFQALYELDNMAVVEVKDSDTLRNAFKILMFPDSHLYQAETPDMKQTWTELLEDTKQKHKVSRDALKREMSSRSSHFHHLPHSPHPPHHHGAHSPLPPHAHRAHPSHPPPPSHHSPSSHHPPPSHLEPPPRPPREPSRDTLRQMRSMPQQTSEPDHRQANLLAADWLKDAPEILDVCIAQRDFNQAIELIDATKTYMKDFSDSHALRDVRARINHRVTQLSVVLMKELESSPNGSLRGGPRAARRAVGLLIKLGHSAKACELFLLNHNHSIRHDLEDVKMEEGATSLYVGNLSSVFFSGLKNAALEFRLAFGSNNGSYSAFVVWCVNELHAFCERCKSVVFTKSPLSTVAECLFAIRKECDHLHTIGLDLTFKVTSNFHPQIEQALSDAKSEVIDKCSLSATPETWQPLDLGKDPPRLAAIVIEMENLGILDFKNKIQDGNVIDLSHTTITFCRLIMGFVSDTMKFYTPELLLNFVDCFCDIFKHMVNLYVDAFCRVENVPVGDFIVADAQFIIETLLPTVGNSINIQTCVQIPDFVRLHDSLLSELHRHTNAADLSPAVRAVEGEEGEEEEEEEGEGSSEDSMA